MEYLDSGKESRTPYRAQPGFEQFGSLGIRAGSCGMGELYRKTYLSLSYYSHVRVKGVLAARPGSEKNFGEAMAGLIVGQAMLVKILRQISKVFRLGRLILGRLCLRRLIFWRLIPRLGCLILGRTIGLVLERRGCGPVWLRLHFCHLPGRLRRRQIAPDNLSSIGCGATRINRFCRNGRER